MARVALGAQACLCSPMCSQQGNEKVLVEQVRQQFKANRLEVDDDKVRRRH